VTVIYNNSSKIV